MILAIDAGNTRIKWGLHDGKGWAALGAGATTNVTAVLGELPGRIAPPQRVAVCNVAGPEVRAAARRLAEHWGAALIEILPRSFQCGVSNGYADPGQLGADRWAAVIAAWRRRESACLVVNAGTAMTVDMLDDEGRFRGGMIVPGRTLMQQVLAERSAALDRGPGRFDWYPRTTANAVYSGALVALVGAVEYVATRFEEDLGAPPAILLAGGDGELVRTHLRRPAEVVEHLVLEGVVCIAREEAGG